MFSLSEVGSSSSRVGHTAHAVARDALLQELIDIVNDEEFRSVHSGGGN